MGIYVFSTDVLNQMLREDDADPTSSHDFGKNIIPKMITDRTTCLPIPSAATGWTWERCRPTGKRTWTCWPTRRRLDLIDRDWIIHTRSEERPPVNIRTGAVVAHSLITDGCVIEGTVEYSVLSPGVYVGRGAVVRDSIILTDTVIENGAIVDRAIVDKQCIIRQNAHVGYGVDYSPNPVGDLTSGISLVGKNATVPEDVRVGRNCIVAGTASPAISPARWCLAARLSAMLRRRNLLINSGLPPTLNNEQTLSLTRPAQSSTGRQL